MNSPRHVASRTLLIALGAAALLACACSGDPDLVINEGATYTASRAVRLSTAFDDSNYGTYQFKANEYGVGWTNIPGNQNVNSSAFFINYSIRGPEGIVTIAGQGRKKGAFGSWSDWGNINPDTIILDENPPIGSLNINSGAIYTNSLNVTLNLSASDVSPVTQFRTQETGPAGPPRAYTTDAVYTLGGSGNRTVQVYYLDSNGHWSGAYSKSIIADLAPPTASPTCASPISTPSLPVNAVITPNASDAVSGVTGYKLVHSTASLGTPVLPGGAWSAYGSPIYFALNTTGWHYFYLWFQDGAGNPSSFWAMTCRVILVDTTPPAPDGVAILSPAGSATLTNATYVTVRATAADATGVSHLFVSTVDSRPAPNASPTPGVDSGWVSRGTVVAGTSTGAVRFSLPPGDGPKTVYVFFKDPDNNVSFTDPTGKSKGTTTLDGTPPLAGGQPPLATVTTLAGTGSAGSNSMTPGLWVAGNLATFNQPKGIIFSSPDLLVCDFLNNCIRRVRTNGQTSYDHYDYSPEGVAFVPGSPSYIYGTDQACQILVRQPQPSGSLERLEVPSGKMYSPSYPVGVFYDATTLPPSLIVTTADGALHRAQLDGTHVPFTPAPLAGTFNKPTGFARDPFGALHIADSGNHRIIRLLDTGVAFTYCGSSQGLHPGIGTAAKFRGPTGLSADPGGSLYVADEGNHAIRRILPSGEVTTLAGGNGPGLGNSTDPRIKFNQPYATAVDPTGVIFVSDTGNHAVRKIVLESPAGFSINDGDPIAPSRDVRLRLFATDQPGQKVTGFCVTESPSRPAWPAAGIPLAPPATILSGGWYAVPDPFATTLEVGFRLSAGVGLKTLWLWFRDEAGNLSIPAMEQISFAIPPLDPIYGSVAIAGQPANPAFIGSRSVTLDIRANSATRIMEFCVGETATTPNATANWIAFPVADFNVQVLHPYAITSPGDGPKTIYVWFRALGTYVIAPVDNSCWCSSILESSPPVVTRCVVNDDGSATGPNWACAPSVKIMITATDTGGSGVAGFYLQSTDPSALPPSAPSATDAAWIATGPVQLFADAVDGRLTPVNEEKKVWVWAKDAAGNVSVPASDTIRLDTGAPRNGTLECEVTTLAGSGSPDDLPGTGSAAAFNQPRGLVVEPSGNLFVADFANNKIKRVTRAGVVSDYAGTGTPIAVAFPNPWHLAFDAAGNLVVTSMSPDLRRIAPDGTVSPPVTGFGNPWGVAAAPDGTLFIADTNFNRLSRLDAGGYVAALAGVYNAPCGLVRLPAGDLLVADMGNHRIRRVAPDGSVATFAGTTTAGDSDGDRLAAARFNNPYGLVVDPSGTLYVSELSGHRIRRISPAGIVSTLAGGAPGAAPDAGFADGAGPSARFSGPLQVALDDARSLLYVADMNNHRVRRLALGESGRGFAREGSGLRLTAEDDYSGVMAYLISPRPSPPPAGAVATTAFNGPGDYDKWIVLPAPQVGVWSTTLASAEPRLLYGWFRDAAGNVSSMAVCAAGNAAGMRAVATLGSGASLSAPHAVALDSIGRVVVADRRASAASPLARFVNDADASPARLGASNSTRDSVSRSLAGVALLPGDLVAAPEIEKARVGIYDATNRFVASIAKAVDLAANTHGIGAYLDLPGKVSDKYAVAGDAVCDARVYPNQTSATPDPFFRPSTIEVFADSEYKVRLTEPVRVTTSARVHMQVRGSQAGGLKDKYRAILLKAGSSDDARGTAVELVETGCGTSIFHGMVDLAAVSSPGEGAVGVATGNGAVTLELPGKGISLGVRTWRPRPFGNPVGTMPGETREVDLSPDVSMIFCWIPPGTFMMGSPASGDPDASEDEKNQHPVTLTKGFWLQQTECTQGQWLEVMAHWPGTAPSAAYGLGSDYPAYYLSWFDGVNYCNRLSQMQGLTPLYTDQGGDPVIDAADTAINCNLTAKGYRLPTEAEWEYACRAGTTTRFYWGDTESNAFMWYVGNSSPSGSKPVATRTPNAWKLHDMSGNVWEWCSDRYGSTYYSEGALTDPQGPATGPNRVLRGGSWDYIAGYCRSAFRFSYDPAPRHNSGGFRPVLATGQ